MPIDKRITTLPALINSYETAYVQMYNGTTTTARRQAFKRYHALADKIMKEYGVLPSAYDPDLKAGKITRYSWIDGKWKKYHSKPG